MSEPFFFRFFFSALFILSAGSVVCQTVTVADAESSGRIGAFICYSIQTGTHYQELNGQVKLKEKGYYLISHPAYESRIVKCPVTDTTVYLQPLARILPEVIVVPKDAEALYEKVIQRYQQQLFEERFVKELNYAHTNKFQYLDAAGKLLDSGLTQSESVLRMKFSGKENSLLFALKSSAQRWEDFRTDRFPAGGVRKMTSLSRFNAYNDLTYYFLHAKSLARIGFNATVKAAIADTVSNRTLLLFENGDNRKQVVFNNSDSTLVSFYYQVTSGNGAYECHYALFDHNSLYMLYNERVLHLGQKDYSQVFVSIHQLAFSSVKAEQGAKKLESFSKVARQIDEGAVVMKKPDRIEQLRFYSKKKRR